VVAAVVMLVVVAMDGIVFFSLLLRVDNTRIVCFKNSALPLRSKRSPISVRLSVRQNRILVDVLKGFAQSSAKSI
jgi:hypothetical protein